MAAQPQDQDGQEAPGAVPGLAGSVIDAPLMTASSALTAAHAVAPELFRDTERHLVAGLEALHGLRADLDRMTVAVLLEATGRGCHVDSRLSVHDWVTLRCPGLPRAEVSDLVTVVSEGARPENAPVLHAVASGDLSPRRAARVLRALARLRPAVDTKG